eukprot:TRINITY_DN10130_c0_g1_i4.p1 TRINITY_DN10130_c0_g1~~TRINITY_DN10130_c0_g1_i4.p1  ORF type:complete len:259 (+),score=22.57 TRINITY_DN10130_c0_g1_i4:190-966(+)
MGCGSSAAAGPAPHAAAGERQPAVSAVRHSDGSPARESRLTRELTASTTSTAALSQVLMTNTDLPSLRTSSVHRKRFRQSLESLSLLQTDGLTDSTDSGSATTHEPVTERATPRLFQSVWGDSEPHRTLSPAVQQDDLLCRSCNSSTVSPSRRSFVGSSTSQFGDEELTMDPRPCDTRDASAGLLHGPAAHGCSQLMRSNSVSSTPSNASYGSASIDRRRRRRKRKARVRAKTVRKVRAADFEKTLYVSANEQYPLST